MMWSILVCLLATAYAKHEGYNGWKTYYVAPSTFEELQSFGSLVQSLDLDVIGNPLPNREGLVLVQPDRQASFTNGMDALGISYSLHTDDIKAKLDYDDMLVEEQRNATMARGDARIPYNNYQEWEVIDAYMQDIARRFPRTVTLVTAANSFERRPIRYLRISTTNFQNNRNKPVIVIDAAMHAREWITPPTVTWAIHKLTEDVTEPDLLDRFDWILLPVANPDGYKFSFTNTRFWRKTRSTDQSSASQRCPGVDGNRNFDFFWNTVGTSSNACSDTYGGSRAFSEIETRVVRDILRQHLHRISLYLTMHSFGSMILYGWGHDGSLSHNAFALQSVGVSMAQAIDRLALSNFRRYQVGNSVLVLGYGASGASEDYAHAIGVPLSYTYELPGHGRGLEGFNLPPRYIQQVARETWAGIVIGARRSGDLFRPRA